MTAPGNYPAIHTGGLAVIPIEHQTLLSAGLREKERGSGSGSGSGSGPYPSCPYWGIIQITNPVAQVDFQHYFLLSWKPGMQFDFKDIRFAQQDGTICPYWIETYTSGVSATVWIKVPSANQRQILLYYGNPQATSESSLFNTMDWGDDFNDNSINSDIWDTTAGTTGLTETGGEMKCVGGTGCGRIKSKTSFSSGTAGFIMEAKVRCVSVGATGFHPLGTWTDYNTAFIWFIQSTCDYYRINSSWVSFGAACPKSTALRGKMIYKPASDNKASLYVTNYSTGAAVYSAVNITKTATNEIFSIGKNLNDVVPSTMEAYWDWVYVRKYAATEPTLALKQYGPRPGGQVIYYPFLPSPLTSIYLKYDELIELTQTMTGETPLVSLGPTVTFTQTMIGSTPITDYYEAAIAPTQTQRVKVFAKLFLNLSLVRTKKITISKSIQDSLWRADIDLHQYKNLDMAVLRHCTYSTTDHLGSSHTLFTGILPGSQPQLAPADETTRITGYDYGWYLTQRKVPEAYLHNTAATNPTAVIRGLLGGDDWMTETGIEPYSIQTVSEWGTTLNRRVFDFDRSTSRLQAIQRICDYTRYVFIVKWRDIGGGILNPCAYFCHEDDIDTYLDLPAEVTFTKPDPYVEEKIIWDVKGDERFNRVTVYGRKSDGTSISYTAETADVTNGDEIPVEFVESSGAFTTEAQVQARAEELLTYFSTTQKTYTVTLNLRTDLELLQKVKFVGWSEIPEDTMRIIAISYMVDDATATKRVQVQVTSETKLSQIRRMYRGMNPDPLSEADALFDAKASSMPGNSVGTITAISDDGTEATVELEDGRTVTARIV